MSLVILSSGQNRYNDDSLVGGFSQILDRGTGLSQPSSFQNALQAPLKIAPNSEVAVVSAKINRDNYIELPTGLYFNWYIGSPLHNTNELRMMTSDPFQIYVKAGTYSYSQFPVVIQDALRGYMHHPDYWNRATCTTKQIDSDGGGYVFQSKTGGDHAAINLFADMDTWTPSNPVTVGVSGGTHWTIAEVATGQRLTRNITSPALGRITQGWLDCSVIGEDYPLSSVNGYFDIDLAGGAGVVRTAAAAAGEAMGFIVGLTRPTNYYNSRLDGKNASVGEENLFPPYFSGENGFLGFWDYAVRGYLNTTTNKFTYEILHSVARNKGPGGEPVMGLEPLEYYGSGIGGLPTAQVDEDGTGLAGWNPAWTIDRLRFGIKGESVKIELASSGGAAPGAYDYVLCDPELTQLTLGTAITLKQYTPKPVGDPCRALYPKMCLRRDADEITMNTWGGVGKAVNLEDYEYPQPRSPIANTPGTSGSSWWGLLTDGSTYTRADLNIYGRNIECNRNIYNYDAVDTTAYHSTQQYRLLDTSTAGSDAPNYSNVLLLQPSAPGRDMSDKGVYVTGSGWTTGWSNIRSSPVGDVSMIMGFPGQVSLTQGNIDPRTAGITAELAAAVTAATGAPAQLDDARGWWWIASQTTPEFHQRSVFIKSPSLTHQSYNGSTGSMSKILAHLPRFDNAGNEFGSLYFQMNDRVYLKLNNPNEVILQDIQIDLCGGNERIAKDLGGTTEIVLHIRNGVDPPQI
jgi:hypothetical protein